MKMKTQGKVSANMMMDIIFFKVTDQHNFLDHPSKRDDTKPKIKEKMERTKCINIRPAENYLLRV